MQNAYIQIFKNLKSFDQQKGNLDSWLTKIVINEALQLIRKQKTRVLKERDSQEQYEISSSPDILKRLHAEDLLKILNQLPDVYRVVFNLNVVEGYSHREIGEMLHVTESTSRSQLTRAKQMLRKLLIEKKKLESC